MGAIGLFQGMSGALSYTLITDFFAPRNRVRAFFVFSILSQLGDTARFMTPNIITLTGYKVAWFIIGGFGIISGALILLTVVEPPRSDTQKVGESKDSQDKMSFKKVATTMLEKTDKHDKYEIHESNNEVLIKRKRKNCRSICSEYKRSFGLLFTNFAAVMIIIGCFIRLWQTSIVTFFMTDYFKVYPSQFNEFSTLSGIGSFIGGPLSTLISGIVIDYFQSEMTIPMLCLLKAFIDIPFQFMIFFQQKYFYLSIAGIYGEYFFSKGWTAPAILILKTVVDPSIASLSVSMFLLTANLNAMISARTMGYIVETYNIHPSSSPERFGYLITAMTSIPCLLCAPFFLISGLKMRAIKRA
jgi:sugar phosphate permease